MAASCRFERSIINHDENEIVRVTHHPAIYDLTDDDLQAARKQLRGLHEKERTFVRQNRRSARGKSETRGGSFPGTYERPTRRKQVFAAAVKRVSKELDRRAKLEARASNVEAARKALALRRAANFATRPPEAGDSAHSGMPALENARRRTIVTGKRIGSVSQAVKASQARRDKR